MLKLRSNLFYGLNQQQVYQGYQQFWETQGYQLIHEPSYKKVNFDTFVLYRSDGIWTLLDWCAGWEWVLRRQAQLFVSRLFGCPGLLVFVYDGEYWGYELFHSGEVLDHFVQAPWACTTWFPDSSCHGNPELFAAQFPWLHLSIEQLASYLVQQPDYRRMKRQSYEHAYDRLNVLPAGRGNQYNRFDECAILDFLRFLGLHIELRQHTITPLVPLWQSFTIRDHYGKTFVFPGSTSSST